MERFSQRESILLGYSHQRSFLNDKTSDRDSDVDFNDVFGGPPRRFSINHETRYSFSEATADDNGLKGEDETTVSRNSWNGLSEKPVFGEEGLSRRRLTSENFFNDIYKGNECLSSSPRKRDWDPYGSSPGSRVLSPARPLPPAAEPFGASAPAQFSLPARLSMKGIDLPAFGSSPQRSKDGVSSGLSFARSKSSIQNQNQEERSDTKSTYRQSILSRELSLKESSINETDTGGDSKEDLNSSKGVANGKPFHFSIYKWASKGAPVVVALRGGSNSRLQGSDKMEKFSTSGDRIESESVPRELSMASLHDAKLAENDRESAGTDKLSMMEQNKQDNDFLPDTINKKKEDAHQIADSDKAASECVAGKEAKPLPEVDLSEVDKEAPKPEVKTVHSLFFDNDLDQGIEKINNNASGKESKVKITKPSYIAVDISKSMKKQEEKKTTNNGSRTGKVSLQGSPRSQNDSGKTRVRGRVKEFVKIFNQEALPKPKGGVDARTPSNKWKEKATSKPEEEAKFNKRGTDMKTQIPIRQYRNPVPDASIMDNEHLQHSEKQHSANENDKDASVTAPKPNGLKSKPVFGDVEDTFQENFQVKELAEDEPKITLVSNDHEEIQDVDAKIRKWSHGKEGNIRSLLSTLQYVLWPGSGWKPVPLVDIIEANSVKKSYQKALLCLHPDKLQQKGAASHQKYIAEKVFDLLQDAWTHFNSLGSL